MSSDNVHEGHRKRLREAYLSGGLEGFEDHQALELLLSYSIPRQDTNVLAHTLMNRYGSLSAVLAADPYDLMQIPGVGERTAVLLSLTGALGYRIKRKKRGCVLKTPAAAMEYVTGLLADKEYETLFAISLDKNRRVLYADQISKGTLTETVLHPRLVVESALRHHAHGMILTHNHPSGDPQPSPADISATDQVRNALQTIGISLLDHLIVGAERVYSFTMDAQLTGGDVRALAAMAAERNPNQ